ncbi:MAG: DUF3108 domain-containing protein [Acidobacteriia bacterium]|nr:DUF3108 domain-containing protein [Terriglobia bacterium]
MKQTISRYLARMPKVQTIVRNSTPMIYRVSLTLAFFVALALVTGKSRSATEAAPQSAKPPAAVEVENQTLNYNVYWRAASAGVASIRVDRDPSSGQLKITGDAHSSRFVSTLYRVEDQFESLVALKNFCSLRIMKRINEGRRHRETIVDFPPGQKTAQLQDRNLLLPSSPIRKAQTATPGCVQDVLSALFYMQTQPFTVGNSVQFPVNDGGKTYNVTVEIQQRETIKTDAGTFQAIRVEPKVFEGLFRQAGRMYVWYTDEPRHRLVQLKARISVGTITASLASSSGTQPGASTSELRH